MTHCTWGGVQPLHDYLQTEYVLNFLMGLNESYTQIRGQILLMDPIPPINKVFSLVLQEEQQREVSSSSAPTQVAFAIKASTDDKSNAKKSKKDHPLCSHCGILGHT